MSKYQIFVIGAIIYSFFFPPMTSLGKTSYRVAPMSVLDSSRMVLDKMHQTVKLSAEALTQQQQLIKIQNQLYEVNKIVVRK